MLIQLFVRKGVLRLQKVVELFKNKKIGVKEMVVDNKSYTYVSEVWHDGNLVSILPYKIEEGKQPVFLASWEYYPPHKSDERDKSFELYSITGGMGKNDETPVFTAKRTLLEKIGCKIPEKDFTMLGTSKIKMSDVDIVMFAVDISNSDLELKKTDTEYAEFITIGQLVKSKDTLLHAMIALSVNMGLI